MGKGKKAVSVLLVGCMTAAMLLAGCGDDNSSGKTEIEIIQYKMEATDYFDALEEEFNATHDDIHLTIDSPNDASTIMKTRFIREDYPDIIGIGGDINYSYYVDAEILADLSDWEGMADIKQSYIDIAEDGRHQAVLHRHCGSSGDCSNGRNLHRALYGQCGRYPLQQRYV